MMNEKMIEKRTYKDFEKRFIGASDSAYLTITGANGTKAKLKFGEDGEYYAYIVPENVEIGNHYVKRAEFEGSVTITDDDGDGIMLIADKIEFFRAGEFGCIVRLSRIPEAVEVAARILESNTWDGDACRELCDLAGIVDEWDAADGDTFEDVVYKAARILGVEI